LTHIGGLCYTIVEIFHLVGALFGSSWSKEVSKARGPYSSLRKK
jgi:hypothetical protein